MAKKFKSHLLINSETYQINQKNNLKLIKMMKDLEQKASFESEKRRDRFKERNQLSPRERLSALVDPGMPFLQLFNMTGYLADDPKPKTSIPGASIISGMVIFLEFVVLFGLTIVVSMPELLLRCLSKKAWHV